MRFTLLVTRSPNDKGYWTMVPALPGCFSAGDTFEEVQENVREAIALHLREMVEDGEDIPIDGDYIVAQTEVDLKAKA